MIQIIELISNQITVLEAIRDRDEANYTDKDAEMLGVLNLCYDLLTRTEEISSIVVKQPEEMKEPGHEEEYIRQYGITSNAFADFCFNVATKTGKVDMRELLRWFIPSYRKTSILTDIREATISDYLTYKRAMLADNYEKIINSTLNTTAMNNTYDVHFNDESDSNNKGFKISLQDAISYVDSNNGSNNSYFADYKGGTVSVVCNETGFIAYEAQVK